ncbi:hypothetical protein JW992_05200 [candidate division KSB1 bacterium]|nr:hypothetical protein [candidate division KSB1 bacterium]
MKPKFRLNCCVFVLWLVVGCSQEKYPLPSPQNASTSFGANDTSYIELFPMWDSAQLGVQLEYPVDIVSGPDGLIFVADEGNDRIVVLTKAGQVQSEGKFARLARVARPRALAIDSKLNLMIANGSDTLYCWNQYLNTVDIDSVAESAVFIDTESGNPVTLTWAELIQRLAAGEEFPPLVRYNFEKNDALVEQARQPYPLYVDARRDASFNGVAAGSYGSEQLYISDGNLDRIISLIIVPQRLFRTRQGSIVMHYRALYTGDIATFGTGAGTVDDPRAMTADQRDNIYFTQLSGNFLVQKLRAPQFEPQYILYQHDIMDLERFVRPFDLALDDANDIFVMDTGAGQVFKFHNSGSQAGQVSSLGDRGLSTARFEDARGIMVSGQVVYVVESGKNRIRRFQYSVSEDDLPDDQKKP